MGLIQVSRFIFSLSLSDFLSLSHTFFQFLRYFLLCALAIFVICIHYYSVCDTKFFIMVLEHAIAVANQASSMANSSSTMASSSSTSISSMLVGSAANLVNQPLLLLSNMSNMVTVMLDNSNYIFWKHQITMVLETYSLYELLEEP